MVNYSGLMIGFFVSCSAPFFFIYLISSNSLKPYDYSIASIPEIFYPLSYVFSRCYDVYYFDGVSCCSCYVLIELSCSIRVSPCILFGKAGLLLLDLALIINIIFVHLTFTSKTLNSCHVQKDKQNHKETSYEKRSCK